MYKIILGFFMLFWILAPLSIFAAEDFKVEHLSNGDVIIYADVDILKELPKYIKHGLGINGTIQGNGLILKSDPRVRNELLSTSFDITITKYIENIKTQQMCGYIYFTILGIIFVGGLVGMVVYMHVGEGSNSYGSM